MNPNAAKTPAIQALLRSLVERFGTGAFPLEGDGGESLPDMAFFRSSCDRRVAFWVSSTGRPEGRLSVIVEATPPQGRGGGIVSIREDLGLGELLGVFERFGRPPRDAGPDRPGRDRETGVGW
jgi:hypothetical protein